MWYNKDLLLECLSHKADCLMSQSLTVPLLLLYANVLHSIGWNSAAVITSVSSSILAGFISTISDHTVKLNLYDYGIKKVILVSP